MEKESYSIFIDNSGSVSGSRSYWTTISTIIKKHGANICNYYLWNSTCE